MSIVMHIILVKYRESVVWLFFLLFDKNIAKHEGGNSS